MYATFGTSYSLCMSVWYAGWNINLLEPEFDI